MPRVSRPTALFRSLHATLLAALLWSLVGAASAQLLSSPRQLTFEGRRSGEGYFSADGTLMVFQSERDAANPFYQIHLLDLDSGDIERVSPGVGKTTCAWVHPSNQRVLYASTHADPAARDKMQAELAFRAAGKSRRYAWDYDEHFDLYAWERGGGDSVNLTDTPGYDAEGAYSPDGTRIVFASNRRAYSGEMSADEAALFEHDQSSMMDLYLMDADGSNLRRLTDAPGYDGGPFFSADGRSITWRRFSTDGATAEIYSMDLADGETGGQERQLTRMGVMSWAPYFHPSGEYLMFASNREGFANFELFLVDAKGRREPVRVTERDGFDGLPVFSPDGERLSWTSNATAAGQSQIFIADWDHAAARRALGLDAPTDEAAAALAPPDTAGPIAADDARAHVERLAGEAMGGRLTGTDGERLAAAYIATVFAALGLEPGGDDGGWFQAFSFSAGVSAGDGNRLRLSGSGAMAGPPDGPLAGPVFERDWRPLALSRNGPIGPAGIVFAGYGIEAPAIDQVPAYDAYGELDVAGQWVMVLRFVPEDVPPDWRRHLIHYADLRYKAAVAKRHGALGLIVVTGPRANARERLVELRQDAGGGTALAGVALGDELAARLLAAAGHDLEALQQRLDSGEAVAGFALDGLELAAAIDLQRERRSGRNVIGVLHAAPDKAQGGDSMAPVIIGAHYDHLGHGEVSGSLARDDERGQVHPGADDNASGVAALLEVAQYLQQRRQGRFQPVRDVRFAAWSGEELGTLGSSAYVERLIEQSGEQPVELSAEQAAGHSGSGGDLRGKVAAYLNMDMVGHLRDKVYLQGAASSPTWRREIERRNVPVGLPIATNDDPYLPTDATPFYLAGVPVLSAFTGSHEDYSSPRDTPDALNYAGIRDIARLMAGITASLARSAELPEYVAVERKKSGLSRRHLRAYLGTIPAYGQDPGVTGVKLQGAVKGGPAAVAGVRGGDVLVALAGVEVASIQDFMAALAGLKAGDATTLTVLRDGARVQLAVVPGARD